MVEMKAWKLEMKMVAEMADSKDNTLASTRVVRKVVRME